MKNKKELFFVLVFVLLVFVLGFLNPKTTEAIDDGTLGGKPAYDNSNEENGDSWFIYHLRPGESTDDGIALMNMTNNPYRVKVYAADTTKSSSGGFALKQFSEPKDGVGSWVKFYPEEIPSAFQEYLEESGSEIITFCEKEDAEITSEILDQISRQDLANLKEWCQGVESFEMDLDSEEVIIVPFTFEVPKDVDIGEHTGGILIERMAAEEVESEEGASINLVTRVGVRIYETVPGKVTKKLSVEDYSIAKNFNEYDLPIYLRKDKKPENYLVNLALANKGNASTDYEEETEIKDLLFNKKSETVNRKFQVLKNDTFVSSYQWQNPRFGKFSFNTKVIFDDGKGNEQVLQAGEEVVWIFPIRELVIAGLIIAIIVLILALRKYFQKKKRSNLKKAKVNRATSVEAVANKFDLDWKEVAKINKIKPPYTLKKGDVILLPIAKETKEKKKKKQKRDRKTGILLTVLIIITITIFGITFGIAIYKILYS